MKLQVQLVVCTDDGHVEQVLEITVVEKDDPRVEPLDLALAEARSSSTRDSTTSALSRPLPV